jgi:transcription initiation factor TFIIF subunit alpha
MSLFRSSRPTPQQTRAQQRKALGIPPPGASGSTAIKRKIEKPAPQPVPENHTDYKLVSTSRDVLHHIMRFHSTKDVDPTGFTAPVKLHRKRNENSYYRGYYNKYNNKNMMNNNNSNNKDGAAGTSTSATGGDKKDGSTPAPGATGTPTPGADMALIAPFGGGARNREMLFKKRTRQIYIGKDDERQKKEIESAPWVVEDYDSKNTWTGQLEGGQHANYVLFVFSDDGFKVVPADKWYTFTPKIPYTTLTAEEAEEQVRI